MTDSRETDWSTSTSNESAGVLHHLQQAGKGTLIDKMGIELIEASAERLVARMPVATNTQPHGLLHGGASVVLAETLGSYGAAIHAGSGKTAVGIEVNATHHRSAREGHVTATATALHLGRRTAAYEIVVSDERGKRVASARLTCLLIGSDATS